MKTKTAQIQKFKENALTQLKELFANNIADIKSMMSKQLARELYETMIWYVDTSTNTSPYPLCKPKTDRITVRGWFLITNASDGEVELKFIPSNIPIGKIFPPSIYMAHNKSIYLIGYPEDYIYLLWENISDSAKILTQLELLGATQIIIPPTAPPPAWYDPAWSYRKSHEILVSSAGWVTDYQIRIKVHYGSGVDSGEDVYLNGKCRSDFADLRFTDSDGVTELPYWIESKVDGDYAIVWVRIPKIPQYDIEHGSWNVDGNTYHHRLKITIREESGNDLTDYQVKVIISTKMLVDSGYATSTGNEVRFTDSDGVTLLKFARLSDWNKINTEYWVKIPSLPAYSIKEIYMYFDEELTTVSDASDPDNTFIFFDDFSTQDTSKWNWPSNWEVYNGYAHQKTSTDWGAYNLEHTFSPTLSINDKIGIAIEVYAKNLCTVFAYDMSLRVWDGGNMYITNWAYGSYDYIFGKYGGDWGEPSSCEWNRVKLSIRKGEQKIWIREVYYDSNNVSITTVSKLGFNSKGESYWDWVIVRKYTYPEPTVMPSKIYIYYGNPDATSKSNPKQTLVIYEDMEQQPDGTLHNDAYYDSANKWVRLTRAVNNVNGELDYLTDDLILNVGDGFKAKFQFWIGNGSGADALWLHFYANWMPTGEQQSCGGYQVAYDEYQDQIQLHFNGTQLAYVPQTDLDNATWRDAEVRFSNFRIKIYLDGVLKIDHQDSERTLTGHHFGWGARTGGLNNEHRIRNLKVWKYVDPEPSHGDWGSEETKP